MTGTSVSNCFVSYPGQSLGEMQLVYSTAPADRAMYSRIHLNNWKKDYIYIYIYSCGGIVCSGFVLFLCLKAYKPLCFTYCQNLPYKMAFFYTQAKTTTTVLDMPNALYNETRSP